MANAIDKTDRGLLEELGFNEEELIQGLKRGVDQDPGAAVLLDLWTRTMEKVANAHEDPDVGRVVFEIQRATLYSKAGLRGFAEETWDDAEMLAEATGRDRLIDEVRKQREVFQVLTSTLSMSRAQFHEAIVNFLAGLNS